MGGGFESFRKKIFLGQNFRPSPPIFRAPLEKELNQKIIASLYSVYAYKAYFLYLDTRIEIFKDTTFLSIFFEDSSFSESKFSDPHDFCKGYLNNERSLICTVLSIKCHEAVSVYQSQVHGVHNIIVNAQGCFYGFLFVLIV